VLRTGFSNCPTTGLGIPFDQFAHIGQTARLAVWDVLTAFANGLLTH
jgi:hypothetical protein